jgi:Spy/CpxP family protein refolding chaperone
MIRTRWMWMFGPASLAAIVGCGGGSPPPASAAAAPAPSASTAAAQPPPAATSDVAAAGTTPVEGQDDESMTDVKDHHRHHHHGGFAMFIAMSLDSLGTTPEQDAAIMKIRDDMHAKLLPAHDAEKNVLSVLADGVAAGRVDKAKVVERLATASAGVHDAVADSMNQLHGILTPEQRIALVDKVEAHFKVWSHANTDEEGTTKEGHHGQLTHLAKEIGLSADQEDKIRASFKSSSGASAKHYDGAEGEAHLKAFGAAFEADTFDAKTVTTGGPANAHLAAWGATRMARFYEAVTPVLTPDQRTKLADIIRHHASYKRTQSGT